MAYSSLRSGSDRYAKWLARFEGTTQSTCDVLSRQLVGLELKARVLASFEASYNMEGEVRAYLNTQGISTMLVGQYLNFGRQMLKLTGRFAGETAAFEAAIFVAMWASRGLSQSVLEGIRFTVFGVSAPVGP